RRAWTSRQAGGRLLLSGRVSSAFLRGKATMVVTTPDDAIEPDRPGAADLPVAEPVATEAVLPAVPPTDLALPPDPSMGESLRQLLRIALPLILSSGSLSIQFVIDRMFLTWHSTEALAACMPAGMLHWTVLSLWLGTATYVNTFVAQ